MPAIAHENKILGNTNNLNELSDVNLTSPTSGQVLTIRNGKWVNEDSQAGDSIIYLTKAEYDVLTPVANQMYGITDWSPEALALIKDGEIVANATWSSEKINTQLGLKANSADVPTKAQITNPNLLDNPWFTVNQRGVSAKTSNSYGYDRWKGLYTPSNGLSCVANDWALQLLETDVINELNGKTLTISVMYSDGTIETGTAVYSNSATTTFIDNAKIKIESASYNSYGIGITVKDTNTIKAVKLELGSISTLALDTAPNTATELLKCQRYFYRCNGIYSGTGGNLQFETSARNFVPMRTMPAISNISVEMLTNSWEAITDTNKYAVSVWNNECIRFATFNLANNIIVRAKYDLTADL